jgi:hypothetical protein
MVEQDGENGECTQTIQRSYMARNDRRAAGLFTQSHHALELPVLRQLTLFV